ncbi:MAG: toll/interleukin-1 receptor domain-containing protein [Anaerolineae bacterium]|nr:toll/interleukin-1 receptor domain-containing protein [Anaerolineae bacterium]
MTSPKRPLKVFLCHAHADRDAVMALYTRLTKDGVDAWLDKEKLLPGQDWELEIRKAVRKAGVVVICLSKQFNQAGFRQKEVRLALDTAMEQPEGEIFIIPARLEECDTLESLRKWHEVNLFEDDGYERLMSALRVQAEKIGITNNDLPNSGETLSSDETTPVVDGLNWMDAESSQIFNTRMSDAFPGLRSVGRFENKEAVDRLEILLLKPLHIGLPWEHQGQKNPFWWLRGNIDIYEVTNVA